MRQIRAFEVVFRDAAPVVRHADELFAALFHLDDDLFRARVDRVFHQLFYDRIRAVDHFARRDTVVDVRRQEIDLCHLFLRFFLPLVEQHQRLHGRERIGIQLLEFFHQELFLLLFLRLLFFRRRRLSARQVVLFERF